MSTGLFLVALSGAVVSSVVPLVNAEILLLGLALAAPEAAPLLVIVMAAGQMAGKSALFLGGGRLTPAAVETRLARWRLDGRRRAAGGPLIGLSAFTGLPPFYLVSLAAPALGVRFGTFLAMGLAGRLLRFAVLVALPQLVAIPLLAHIPRPGGF
jgi:membrane protein YqaA with SNARE-associated domain